MDLVQTALNAGVIAVVGALVAAFVNSRTKELKEELKDVKTELKADIGEVKQDVRHLRVEMNDRFAEVNDRFAEVNERFRDAAKDTSALRSDVTQLALALGQRPQPQAG
jgi:phage host-nuclease inhibitor protein Gam